MFYIAGTTAANDYFGDFGTTGSTGIAPATFENIQGTFDHIQDVIALIEGVCGGYIALQSAWHATRALYSKHVLGYDAFDDVAVAEIEAQIAVIRTNLGIFSTALTALTADVAVRDVLLVGPTTGISNWGSNSANHSANIATSFTDAIALGASVDTQLDNHMMTSGVPFSNLNANIITCGASWQNVDTELITCGTSMSIVGQHVGLLGIRVGVSSGNLDTTTNGCGRSTATVDRQLDSFTITSGSSFQI